MRCVCGFLKPALFQPMPKVALRSQKAARAQDEAVVWDYHVILLLSEAGEDGSLLVYDFDTTLPVPCPWEGEYELEICTMNLTSILLEYLNSTFSDAFAPEYQKL